MAMDKIDDDGRRYIKAIDYNMYALLDTKKSHRLHGCVPSITSAHAVCARLT